MENEILCSSQSLLTIMVVLTYCPYFQGSITVFVVDIIKFLINCRLFSVCLGFVIFSICRIGTGLTGIYCVSCEYTNQYQCLLSQS